MIWLATSFILDALITQKLQPGIFSSRVLWSGYVMLLLGPMLWGFEHRLPRRRYFPDGIDTWI